MNTISTYDVHAKQFEQPYVEPPLQSAPTTHDMQAKRYVDDAQLIAQKPKSQL